MAASCNQNYAAAIYNVRSNIFRILGFYVSRRYKVRFKVRKSVQVGFNVKIWVEEGRVDRSG